MNTIIQRYRHPVAFYAAATAVPWVLWSLAGRISYREMSGQETAIASGLAFAGLVAPMAVAFIAIARDRELRADVLSRLTLKGITAGYAAIACLTMLASILLAQAISLLFGYSPHQFVITGHYTFTSGVFPVWFLLIAAPVVEEFAWHSYGTDALRARFNLLLTSIVFATYWAVWHVPLAGIKGYYHANLVAGGALYGVNFLISVFPFVILMNWLYYRTGRNILIACVFHITANYFNEIFATHPDSKVIQTGLLLVLAGIVVGTNRRLFFAREFAQEGQERHSLQLTH
jgi:uncharacterized protein